MRKWLMGIGVSLCLLAAGCTQPDAVLCDDGRWCPQDTKCGPQPKYECLRTNCGDGIVQKDEPCDGDGKGQPGETATCNLDCTWARCGDGSKNVHAEEECDGNDNGEGGETATCNLDCTAAKHGDGKVNKALAEDCDGDNQGHGNRYDCQSPICNANCTVSRHGDGRVNPEAGEECDGDSNGHGNGHDCQSPICNANCTPAKHGDGMVNPELENELCDGDGRGMGNGHDCQSPACNANCTPTKHGDGWVNPEAGEECDGDSQGHGNGHDCQSPTCNANCTSAKHGDGWINPELDHEQCDGDSQGHGNGHNCQSATCNANCTPAKHGDGWVNPEAGEQCDGDSQGHGNGVGCQSLSCNFDCTVSHCGDGKVNAEAGEQCDDKGTTASLERCPYGVKACLKCDSKCHVVQLVGPYCGDGQQAQGKEECDDPRSAACGTCVACKRIKQNGTAPKGSTKITALTVAELAALRGTTVTYDDGGQEVTFQFIGASDLAPIGDNAPVVIDTGKTPMATTTDNLRQAMLDKGMLFLIGKTSCINQERAPPCQFDLTGRNGWNVPISLSTHSDAGISGIEVSGMSGGFGCAIGESCARDEDCVSGHCSSTWICREQ